VEDGGIVRVLPPLILGSQTRVSALACLQWGLKHYWDALLDADLECDALGWQYVAGCMAGEAPGNGMSHLPMPLVSCLLPRLPAGYPWQPWQGSICHPNSTAPLPNLCLRLPPPPRRARLQLHN
jgi:hypothetical protein